MDIIGMHSLNSTVICIVNAMHVCDSNTGQRGFGSVLDTAVLCRGRIISRSLNLKVNTPNGALENRIST